MARIAFFEKQEPVKVGDKMVCQCGLSKDFPFCDGSHLQTKDEEVTKLYQYVNGEKIVVGEMKQSCDGHCHCDDDHCHDDKEDCCSDDKKDDSCCGDHHE